MHRNDRAVGIRRRISFIIIAALLKEILPPANVQEWDWVKSPATRGACGALMGFSTRASCKNIRASWQESAGDLSLLASHLLEFAFLPRVSKRGKTCFSVSAHIARKFFRLFLKLHSSPNGAAPASFMQGYCNGLPTNKKHFFGLF